MRKTKNIILPTKCLNQMGFLLLFLSCPVIGDWGRIRPDTEMSQWSIIVEKEGTCGLTRDPPGINDEFFLDGSTEHGNMLEARNDTLPKAEESSPSRETGGHESSFPLGIDARRTRSQSEGRISRERREERSLRDTRNAIRYGRETREGRRLAPETPRRLSQRAGNERIRDSAERRFDARRATPEPAARTDDARYRRIAREERSRRVERRIDEMTRGIRSERRESERSERRDSRSPAREERDERKPEDRRSREIVQTRRSDISERRDADERQRRSERRASNQRERTDDGSRIDSRRQDRRTRSERSVEGRRIEADRSRRQDGLRRLEKWQRERVLERGLPDRCNKLEPFALKHKKPEESRVGEFFYGVKNWFKQKTGENSWVGRQGDFATTCLVGAAAYFLTTHHNKSN